MLRRFRHVQPAPILNAGMISLRDEELGVQRLIGEIVARHIPPRPPMWLPIRR